MATTLTCRRPWPPQHSPSQHEEARTETGRTTPQIRYWRSSPLVDDTSHCTSRATVTVAVGHGGRHDVTDAQRGLMLEAAEGQSLTDAAMNLTTDNIAPHLYTAGRRDLDLVIGSSGKTARVKLRALAERVRPS